jgi:hypothetical protein
MNIQLAYVTMIINVKQFAYKPTLILWTIFVVLLIDVMTIFFILIIAVLGNIHFYIHL